MGLLLGQSARLRTYSVRCIATVPKVAKLLPDLSVHLHAHSERCIVNVLDTGTPQRQPLLLVSLW